MSMILIFYIFGSLPLVIFNYFFLYFDFLYYCFLRVIATQLSSYLTKHLVLTDPYRIKSPAENSSVDFPLPLGVQLLQVYVDTEEYKELIDDATKCRSISQFLIKKDSKMVSCFFFLD